MRGFIAAALIFLLAPATAWPQFDPSEAPFQRATRMVSYGRTALAFEPVQSDTQVAVRHRASGVTCRFARDDAAHVTAQSEDDVACELINSGGRVRFLVTRADGDLDTASAAYFSDIRGAVPQAEAQSATAAVQSGLETRTMTLVRPRTNAPFTAETFRLSAAIKDGWLVRMYATKLVAGDVTADASSVGAAEWDALLADWTAAPQ